MSRIEAITQTFKQLSQLAAPTNGWIRPASAATISGQELVMLTTLQRDMVRMKKNKFLKNFTSTSGASEFVHTGWPTVLDKNVAFIQPSPTWKRLAIVRGTDKKEEEKEKYSIEIWDAGQLLSGIATDGKHAQIYSDVWFGSLVWSPDEKYLAYIAEKNADKVAGFFDLEKKDDITPGGKFRLQEDWGETYKGGQPSIFACSLDEGVVAAIDGVPENISAGQVQFSPSGDELVFVGWPNEPRRLGIVHCYNRPSAIYSVPFDKAIFTKAKEKKPEAGSANGTTQPAAAPAAPADKTTRLTNSHPVSRSPRFSPNGSHMVYLASNNTVTHNSASKLCIMDWKTKAEKTVVDIPEEDYNMDDKEKFPGIFCHFLASNPFLDEKTVVFESFWRSRQILLSANLDNGSIQKVPIPTDLSADGSIALLDVRVKVDDALGGSVLLDSSAPDSPNRTLFGTLNSTGDWNWKQIPVSDQHKELHESMKLNIGWSIGHIPTAEFIHVFPKSMSSAPPASVPVILYPHGGPHSTSTVAFTITASLFARLGYAVIFINYRGSLGFGKKFVDSLLGHVGDYDIQDCIDSLKKVLSDNPQLNSQKVFVYPSNPFQRYGGSHGGWIGAHLATRAEQVGVRATSLVNPVTNIAHNYGISDIPDWCVYEAGLDSLESGNTLEGYKRMFEISPVGRIDSKTAPSLMVLGAVDKRVPPSNGVDFYYQLKQRNVKTKLLRYPGGGHGLVDLEHEADLLVNTVAWFDEHNTSS